jgi:hypothetical protein
MTAAIAAPSRAKPETVASRVVLSCDDSGSWALAEPGAAARHFPDFPAALEGARHAPNLKTATIEVWQGGEYICCLPPEEWSRRTTAANPASTASQRDPFASVERSASRTARVTFAAGGPLFWVSLFFVAVAASLGWRFLVY